MRRSALCAPLFAILLALPLGTARASHNVPPPAPEPPPAGVVRTQALPADQVDPSTGLVRTFSRAPAAGETLYVWSDSLNTRSSPSNEGGFTHYDSSVKPTAWHIDNYLACQGNAMWCGLFDTTYVCPSHRGYDNDWTQYLMNKVDLTTVPPGTPVSLSFKFHFDAEPNYDFGYVEVLDLVNSWTPLVTLTGKVNNAGTCDTMTLAIPDSIWTQYLADSTGSGTPMPFRFTFTSDVGYSTADGFYCGDGFVVDNVTVKAGSTVKFFDDFEHGYGTWQRTVSPGVGDYFWLRSNVTSEDVCSPNHGTVWTDWDPLLESFVPRQDNFVVTPPVGVNHASVVFTAFDVYRNLPLNACYFYHLNFRTKNIGDTFWSNWIDPTEFVYYGGNKDWIRQYISLAGASDHDSVQVELGFRDYGPIYCGGSVSSANIYSYYDNIAIGVIGNAPPTFISRDIDLFQDSFFTSPFMYRDDNFNTPVGDSAVVQVNASHGYRSGFMYYRLNNGSFSSIPLQQSTPAAPAYRYADVPAGSYPANTVLSYYFAVTDSLNNTSYLPANAPTSNTYFTASVLPLKSATNPALGCTDSLAHILFVNHFSGREPQPYIANALTAWGYKFDTWDVNGPSSGIGNCLGGSPVPGVPQEYWPATDVNSLLQYSTIIWNSGNLTSFTITPLDEAVIQSWIQQAGRDRNFYITGDDVGYELSVLGADYNSFLSFTCGVQFLRNDWENLPKDTLNPVITGPAGGPTAGRFFHLNGGCPLMNNFDLIQLSTQAQFGKSGILLTYPNTFPAATRYATKYTSFGTDSARVAFEGFSFNYIQEGGERLQLLKSILTGYFKEPVCYYASGVPEDTPGQSVPGIRDALEQNAPNPFNPETAIGYSVSQAGPVEIRIYNVAGALVRRIEQRASSPGRYAAHWDGTDDGGRRLASGVYFYEIQTGSGFRASRKLLMLK